MNLFFDKSVIQGPITMISSLSDLIDIQVPVTLMRSFSYLQLTHEFSVVITAGVAPDNLTAFLPNNFQVRKVKLQNLLLKLLNID